MIKKFKEPFSCFPSIQWNQTYPIITSQNITLHYITSHAYKYTHTLCLIFGRIGIFPLMPSRWSPFNGPSTESFSQRLHSKTFQIKEFAFSIRLSTSISCQAGLDLIFYPFSIRSTFSSRQAVLDLVPPTLLTMCRRFLDILSICLIKSNLFLIP